MFLRRDSSEEFFVNDTMPSIKTAIADHLVMFFWDMADQTLDEFHNRDGFFYQRIVFMAVIMESHKITIIFINTGSGDHRATKVTTDIFSNNGRFAFVGFGVNIKTIFVLTIATGFYLFKRRTEMSFHFAEESCTEGIAEESVVKVFDVAPETIVAETTFGDETVNVRIPFEVTAKGVEDHDKTGSEIQGMIQVKEHTGDDTADSMKKTVKKRPVVKEEIPEIFIDRKNTVAMDGIDEFQRHGSSTTHGIKISARRAETAMTTKRDKLQPATVRASVHDTAKRRIAAVDHLIDIFHLSRSGMKSIFNFFVMV